MGKNKDKTRKRNSNIKRKNKYKTRKRNSNIKRKNIVKHKSKNNRKTYKMKRNNSNKRRKKIRKKTREKKYKIINQMGGNVDLSSISITWEVDRLQKLKAEITSLGDEPTLELLELWYQQIKSNGLDESMAPLDCLKGAIGGEFQIGTSYGREPSISRAQSKQIYSSFIEDHLEFIVDRALDLEILPDLKDKISNYLSPNKQGVVLTQEECLCIISNSFLSTWNEEGRTSPHCNYAKMFQSYGVHGGEWVKLNPSMKVQKCIALMEYFMKRKGEYESSTGMEKLKNTVVKFQLIEVNEDITRLAATCDYDLLQVNMMLVIPRGTREFKWEEGEEEKYNSRFSSKSKPVPNDKSSARIIDDPEMKSESLNVDFANKAIGGGAMDYGFVQEEEMFTLHTDYCCAGLFCRVMEDNQAILLSGGEQIAESSRHGLTQHPSYWNIEPYKDSATRIELDGGERMFPMYTTAIDALDFRVTIKGDPLLELYSTENFFRELRKCYAGLRADDKNIRYIRTGNFGGGAFLPPDLFRGDNARQDYIVFKGLIQLLAASMHDGNSGKQLDYCPFNEGRVSSRLLELSNKLRESGIKAKQLFDILRSKCTNYQLYGDYIELRISLNEDPDMETKLAAAAATQSVIDGFSSPTLIDKTMWNMENSCWITGLPYTMFNRGHHCRHCGRSVSNARSLRTFNLLDKSGSVKNERVCDFCYTILNGGKPTWQYGPSSQERDQGSTEWTDLGQDVSDTVTAFVINSEGQCVVTSGTHTYTIDPFKHIQFRQDNSGLQRRVMLKKI
jgi:hypothetical protein